MTSFCYKKGSERCKPVISCETPIDLRQSVGSPCQKEHLLLTDGISGSEKYCGNMTVRPTISSSLGRDLYVIFRSAEKKQRGRQHTGFRCSVTCMKPNQRGEYSTHELGFCVA